MPDCNDGQYYARRETRQRALAEKAKAPEIRKIHLDLANGYAERAGQVIDRQRLRIVSLT